MFMRAHEAARAAGISKNTLLRWLKAGKVPEVARDRNGWRVFSEEDVARVVAFADRITPAPVCVRRTGREAFPDRATEITENTEGRNLCGLCDLCGKSVAQASVGNAGRDVEEAA